MRQRGVWRTTAIRAAAPLALCLLGTTGCELGYLITQGTGELGILWGAEDLDELVARETAGADGTSSPVAEPLLFQSLTWSTSISL